LTVDELIAFEKEIAADFDVGKIAAPVHLAGGNEKQLIDIFQHIHADDWVLCSWRSHYHCLLKGVPAYELRAAIIDGHSIALTFPKYKILSSAIVGGICPIATGLAWAIKERNGAETVHVFLGDMTAMAGIYYECERYCRGHDLPVQWWIEDNGYSVCTETQAAWGEARPRYDTNSTNTYNYELTWGHVGTGKWVSF
jgi:pyruvate dehydrogenase E1 component alpha subunit